MGTFIQKYIEPPIKDMGEQIDTILSTLSMEAQRDIVIIRDARGNEYRINRYFVDE